MVQRIHAGSPTRWDKLLDVYLVRPENSLVSYSIVQGISNNCGLLLKLNGAKFAVGHKWKG
jgi:hypothetical protein